MHGAVGKDLPGMGTAGKDPPGMGRPRILSAVVKKKKKISQKAAFLPKSQKNTVPVRFNVFLYIVYKSINCL